ncbi:FadR family transcriptional regulator [Rhodococcus sp. BP-252]|uniref:GntR family transcriptional regulator n=1 Tax=Rhodococcoides kyotonense TaxID=398843 RepID=A0A177YLE4_9NOCA|nr:MULTISPECIES: FCD domain-containing protein [Rhodococcus]MBY6412595.1 FadR family transcriptional regulator [Rhodococcus sp. BP-320]MBY6417150.1 FadR family transcriptional regulator [Rhodococcus sp. BP-321]MBY6423238.1 FadR family transcriptional regulator [Rhodococcus sp. BP-324]MBY6427174.1 FadR family transcriptional regulator [Rhodococcus sp. BP-323]MBY6432213.1 FadR family transcriptional regulator [Rhodococcus sp. BP-322]
MTVANRAPKAAMVIAQQIIRDTLRQGLTAGDLLPPEKAMLEKYQIGRGTLREALRLLEFQGVIALKPGPKGGPVLLDPDASHLASTVILLMQLKNAPFKAIAEARVAMEPMISRLAAERISDESLVQLGGTIDTMRESLDDQYVFLEANKQFHDIIAWSSGNPLFGYIVDSLLGIMDGTIIGIDYPAPRRSAIITAHQSIYDSLLVRDPDLSQDRMAKHINEYVRYAERKFPDVMGSVIQWDRAL